MFWYALALLMLQDAPAATPGGCANFRDIEAAQRPGSVGTYPILLSSELSYSAVEDWCHGWEVVTLFPGRDARGEFYWFRRVTGDESRPGVTEVAWLTTRECPEAVEALERLRDVRIGFLPDLPDQPERLQDGLRVLRVIKIHGTRYEIESHGLIPQPDDTLASLRIAANHGAAAQWVEKTRADLAACWRPDMPGHAE